MLSEIKPDKHVIVNICIWWANQLMAVFHFV